jgi:hypothetical protein
MSQTGDTETQPTALRYGLKYWVLLLSTTKNTLGQVLQASLDTAADNTLVGGTGYLGIPTYGKNYTHVRMAGWDVLA